MAWNTTTWLDADWSLVTNVSDFYNALNERGASLTVPVAGDDVQAVSFWTTLQNWIVSNCTSFVQSHNSDGTARAATYHDGQASIPMWTFENLMQSVYEGTAKTHFRRATTMPTDWTDLDEYSYGVMQAGDIIGPWIFQDLQRAINRLLWHLETATADSVVADYGYATGWPDFMGRASAIAEAERIYDGSFPVLTLGTTSAYAASSISFDGLANTWDVYIWRSRAKGVIAIDISAPAKTVRWYVKPVAYGTFDGNSDFDSGDVNTHVLWETQSVAEDDVDVTSANYSTATDIATYPVWKSSGTGQVGYEATMSAVVQYDFEYV